MSILRFSIFIANVTKSYPCVKKAMYFYSKKTSQDNHEQLINYLSIPVYIFKHQKKIFISISEDDFDILHPHQAYNKIGLVLPMNCNILFEELEYSELLFWLHNHYHLYYTFKDLNIQTVILNDIFSIFVCHWKKLQYMDLISLKHFISHLKSNDDNEELKIKLLLSGISKRLSENNSSILDQSIDILSPNYH